MAEKPIDVEHASLLQAGKLSILEHFWQHSGDNMFVVALVDDEFVIEDFNPSQALNFSIPERARGKKLRDFVGKSIYANVEAQYRRCLAENTPHTYDETHELHGKVRHWNLMIIPVLKSHDGLSRIFGIAREITPLIEARNSLAALNENLEKVISERTYELEQTNKQLEAQAYTDPLTQISNRRHFFHQAIKLFDAASLEQAPISLIYLDMDNFKQINDKHGHMVGDSVLRAFTGRVNNCIRKNEIFARFGGEEFVVLMPHVDADIALQKAHQIRIAIGDAPFKIENLILSITVSIGLSTCTPNASCTLDQFVSFADKALYHAKQNGKNRVEVY